ncbi:MAG: hypothetical protein JST54_00715 [Deltaproteobacteria bacterium]|nr:hypothetical protein [Deltaproteobacteria bacterium]
MPSSFVRGSLLLAAIGALAAFGALGGCDSSANPQDDAGVDAGLIPEASCQGSNLECECTTDADCTLSHYAKNVTVSGNCYCPSPCAYNPVRVDGDQARASAFEQVCLGTGFDGGCTASPPTCQPLVAACYAGACVAFAPDAGTPDAGT